MTYKNILFEYFIWRRHLKEYCWTLSGQYGDSGESLKLPEGCKPEKKFKQDILNKMWYFDQNGIWPLLVFALSRTWPQYPKTIIKVTEDGWKHRWRTHKQTNNCQIHKKKHRTVSFKKRVEFICCIWVFWSKRLKFWRGINFSPKILFFLLTLYHIGSCFGCLTDC